MDRNYGQREPPGYVLRLSRPMLAVGGLCTALVAPEPASGSSTVHGAPATVAFVALALVAASPGSTAVAVLAAGVIWLWVALQAGTCVGVAERCAAVSQALWPIVVVRREYTAALRHAESASI